MPASRDATAVFISRDACISCGSADLHEIGGGTFGENPLRSFIENDPWGENPMPVLQSERWSLVECGRCAQRFHRFLPAALDVYSVGTALWIAVLVNVALLFIWGAGLRQLAGGTGLQVLGGGLASASLGLVLVAPKVLVH